MSRDDWPKIEDLRREYGNLVLSEESALLDPFIQFELWFEEVLKFEKTDPTAMVLSTVDESGFPDSRVVLLKGLKDKTFIFFTNYESSKAKQLDSNKTCALNFYWPQMARQVRIRGSVEKISAKDSDAYFTSRPKSSQVAAMISKQSEKISNRSSLEEAFHESFLHYQEKPLIRPQTWGGYRVDPKSFEFWQGRDNRLHDRLHYFKKGNDWLLERLAP